MLPAGQASEDQAAEDAELVARFRDGDMRAFDMLVQRYENRVFNFTLRMLGDYQNSREVTQDIFLRAFRYLGNYRGDGKFSTWLFTIASSTCKNAIAYYRIRDKYKQHVAQDPEQTGELDPLALVPDETDAPERKLEQNTLSAMLTEAIKDLPETYRKVIVLKDVNDFSYEEIGEIVSIPLGTVKSRIARARLLLREKLTQMGCLEAGG
jgi:RNA polymerase sigma-70 factor (ECF subfamily)